MKTSESIKNLSKALLVAQSKMGAAVKDSKNPFFKSSYSDYNSVLEVVKDPLNLAGIIVLQPTSVRESKTYVETTLIHAETGEFLAGEMEVICAKQNDPQAYGSAITYARRYALQALLSIPSEDSDAEGAMNRAPGKTMTKSVGTQELEKRSVSTALPTTITVSGTTSLEAHPLVTVVNTAPAAEAPKSRTSFRLPPNPKAADASPGLSLKI